MAEPNVGEEAANAPESRELSDDTELMNRVLETRLCVERRRQERGRFRERSAATHDCRSFSTACCAWFACCNAAIPVD